MIVLRVFNNPIYLHLSDFNYSKNCLNYNINILVKKIIGFRQNLGRRKLLLISTFKEKLVLTEGFHTSPKNYSLNSKKTI